MILSCNRQSSSEKLSIIAGSTELYQQPSVIFSNNFDSIRPQIPIGESSGITSSSDLRITTLGMYSSRNLFSIPDSFRNWITIDTLSNSNMTCEHSWVYDESYDPQPGISCLVYHPDGHCSWHDRRRKAICELCHLHAGFSLPGEALAPLHILQKELYTPPSAQPAIKSKYQIILEKSKQ